MTSKQTRLRVHRQAIASPRFEREFEALLRQASERLNSKRIHLVKTPLPRKGASAA